MSKKIETILREAGINPALPHLIYSTEDGVIYASKRMCILLSTFEEKLHGLSVRKLAAQWPFANQEDAGPKIFTNLVEKAPLKINAQSNLQNFLLESVLVPGVGVVVAARLERKGDLLRDKNSRQELFRTLAHELRTSAMALDGYVQMLKDLSDSKDDKKMRTEVLARLTELSKRFGKNTALLDSLRDQLSAEDEDERGAA